MTNAEHAIERALVAMFDEPDDDRLAVEDVRTFADAGVMTRDRGVVVALADGSEFQLTIVQSKHARSSLGSKR